MGSCHIEEGIISYGMRVRLYFHPCSENVLFGKPSSVNFIIRWRTLRSVFLYSECDSTTPHYSLGRWKSEEKEHWASMARIIALERQSLPGLTHLPYFSGSHWVKPGSDWWKQWHWHIGPSNPDQLSYVRNWIILTAPPLWHPLDGWVSHHNKKRVSRGGHCALQWGKGSVREWGVLATPGGSTQARADL